MRRRQATRGSPSLRAKHATFAGLLGVLHLLGAALPHSAAAATVAADALPRNDLPGRAPVVPVSPIESLTPLPDDAADADSAAPDSSAAGERPVTWQLSVEAPDALRALLERYLDLARFQRVEITPTPAAAGAAGAAAAPAADTGIPRSELLRLLGAAPAQARKLLETEGYFDARVTATVAAEPAEVDRAIAAGRPVPVRVAVQPGPRARVEQARIEFSGELAADAEGNDPVRRAAALELMATLRQRWSLPSGEPYTQDAWSDAKGGLLSRLRAEGYAQPTWAGTVAQVDASQARAQLYVVADSGPLFRFGPVRYEGLDHVPPAALDALSTFSPGTPLREKALLDFQDRLIKSTLFDSVAVEFDPDPERAAAAPLTVRLVERALQQATFGIGVSDATGPRLTVEHLHQRLLGFKWQAKTKVQLGRQQRLLSADLTSYPQPGPHRNLIGLAFSSTEAGSLNVTSERLRLGRTQDGERIERLYYFEWQRAFTRSLDDGGSVDDSSSLTYNYQWIWRDLDHPILPTRGVSLSAEAGVGRSFASTDRTGWFGRGLTRLTTYWTPGSQWYGQARIQVGQVFAARRVAVPFTLLFRTGGDEAVRGYAYQSLGPTQADGSAVGGRLLATGSVELARPFSARLPAWWGAAFVDAGNASTSWRNLDPVYGYGVGVRWRSPVGPLRIDLAYGEALRRLRLHLSVGITF